MPNWDFFKWTRRPSRDIKATILRICFTGPDASRDICQAPNCGVTREHHVKLDHHFVEEG